MENDTFFHPALNLSRERREHWTRRSGPVTVDYVNALKRTRDAQGTENFQMTATITLDDRYTADVIDRNGSPVVRVFDQGRITPGQWYASTIASRTNPHAALDIDSGARWTISAEAATKLHAFAIQALVDAGQL